MNSLVSPDVINSHSITHHPKKELHKRRALTESEKSLTYIHDDHKEPLTTKIPILKSGELKEETTPLSGDHDEPSYCSFTALAAALYHPAAAIAPGSGTVASISADT